VVCHPFRNSALPVPNTNYESVLTYSKFNDVKLTVKPVLTIKGFLIKLLMHFNKIFIIAHVSIDNFANVEFGKDSVCLKTICFTNARLGYVRNLIISN
jgi:hypothetical protein